MKKTTTPATPTEFDSTDPILGQSAAAESTTAPSYSEAMFIGKQQDLYLYARLGWRSYLAQQPVFASFSQYFTVKLGEDQLALIAATEALPDQAARVVEPLDAKDELLGLNSAVLQKFMDGTFFIERTWADPTKQATMLSAAGKDYYLRAAQSNWSSTESLISAFKRFLTNYGPAMLDGGWMPSKFPNEFDAVSQPFLTLWEGYKDKWATARQERSVKFDNNNLIYKVLSEMCEVGKRKFADKPDIKKQFTITALLGEVAGHSPSGLQGLCAIGGIQRYPVAGVRLSAMVGTEERVALTDEKGRYFLQLPSGNYAVKMEAEGFVPQVFQRQVKIGVKSRLNVVMERAAVASEAPVVQPSIAPAQHVNLSDMVVGVMEQVGNGVH